MVQRLTRMALTMLALTSLLLLAACGESGAGTDTRGGADSPACGTQVVGGQTDEGVTGGASDFAGDLGAEEDSEPLGQPEADYVYTDTVGTEGEAGSGEESGVGSGATDGGLSSEGSHTDSEVASSGGC